MFTLNDIRDRVGSAEAFQRALGLQAHIVKRADQAVAARVSSPFSSTTFDAMVSRGLVGRCTCGSEQDLRICDHVAAAALEWILEGEVPASQVATPTPGQRFV